MTYEKAIPILKDIKANLDRCGGCYIKGDMDALDLAIELLEEKIDESKESKGGR
jgi:hypothetical protein